jgi:hypothetical protein
MNIGGGMDMVPSCVIDYYCMYHDTCIFNEQKHVEDYNNSKA